MRDLLRWDSLVYVDVEENEWPRWRGFPELEGVIGLGGGGGGRRQRRRRQLGLRLLGFPQSYRRTV